MLAQRATQQSLRRLAASKPSMISQMTMNKFAAPAVGSAMQIRPAGTAKITPADSYEILVAQRKLRPVAPHLTIYEPQIPWIMSGLNRVTGVTLSGGMYIFGAAYLVSPLFGWHMDSATMAAAFGSLPALVKGGLKFVVAMPFTYHSFNGLRHLAWDFAIGFKNINVVKTGWTVVGVSIASALGLAIFV
ncbi:Succinate dehydrogenase cytochrome B [Hyphodiscus hymeniophilus]|uniref:Succinate dehydrogenase cytochrome B n=1 Tax=Hyphodiscus hymeniophilus TaxID=353542 RepID=A0A9P6VER9_9HELO|nr:Succinate dehydrogenase cytochrome B [Hyphodiscus hymeniophilus]